MKCKNDACVNAAKCLRGGPGREFAKKLLEVFRSCKYQKCQTILLTVWHHIIINIHQQHWCLTKPASSVVLYNQRMSRRLHLSDNILTVCLCVCLFKGVLYSGGLTPLIPGVFIVCIVWSVMVHLTLYLLVLNKQQNLLLCAWCYFWPEWKPYSPPPSCPHPAAPTQLSGKAEVWLCNMVQVTWPQPDTAGLLLCFCFSHLVKLISWKIYV